MRRDLSTGEGKDTECAQSSTKVRTAKLDRRSGVRLLDDASREDEQIAAHDRAPDIAFE